MRTATSWPELASGPNWNFRLGKHRLYLNSSCSPIRIKRSLPNSRSGEPLSRSSLLNEAAAANSSDFHDNMSNRARWGTREPRHCRNVSPSHERLYRNFPSLASLKSGATGRHHCTSLRTVMQITRAGNLTNTLSSAMPAGSQRGALGACNSAARCRASAASGICPAAS